MSLYTQAREFIQRHQAAVTRAVLALLLAMVIVGWQVDQLKNALVGNGVLLLLVLAFVAEMSISVSKLSSTVSEMSTTMSGFISVRPRVDVARNEDENADVLKSYLEGRPPAEKVDMLEYSAVSVHNLIQGLAKKGAFLRILIKHPGTTTGVHQRTRILNSIAHLERFVLRDRAGQVEIRCYEAPASLRGRKFDDLLVDVGWYTPDLGEQGEDWEVVGHDNPVVLSSVATEEGQHLREMFDRVFESLWESAKDNDARKIARFYRESSMKQETR